MKCKYLTPIMKKRVEGNPELANKYFCLRRITKLANKVYLEKNYDLILCVVCPTETKDCPHKVSESFGAELKSFVKFFITESPGK